MHAIESNLLTRLRESPESLTSEERARLAHFATTGIAQHYPLLISQKDAAFLLAVNRTTIWRLVTEGIVLPVEVTPGMLRYRRDDIENLAKYGWKHLVANRRKAA